MLEKSTSTMGLCVWEAEEQPLGFCFVLEKSTSIMELCVWEAEEQL